MRYWIIVWKTGIYGKHKLVSEKKDKNSDGEITEEKKLLEKELDGLINLSLASNGYNKEFLIKIGKFYIKGAEVFFKALYQNEKLKKVKVPLYKFDDQRVWFEIPDIDLGEENYPGGMYYQGKWIVDKSTPEIIDNTGTLLIFMDKEGIGRVVADKLKTAGRSVIEVVVEENVNGVYQDNDCYNVGLDEGQIKELFERLKDKKITQILHLLLW